MLPSNYCTCAPPMLFFFFNDTATTEIYTLSLHDALPISSEVFARANVAAGPGEIPKPAPRSKDRKSTRLNSSHSSISYAVFCLKKKKTSYNNKECRRPRQGGLVALDHLKPRHYPHQTADY